VVRAGQGIQPLDDLVTDLTKPNGRFVAWRVASASPPRPWSPPQGFAISPTCRPGRARSRSGRAVHTCDLVRFEDLAGARVLVVGGRQSAFEWAALLAEHGAERIDLVHRHDIPRFERVSWRFIDPHVDTTLRGHGWWRALAQAEQDAISRRFWEVGRLTLEHWLIPRLTSQTIHRWPQTEVVQARPVADGRELQVRLSNAEELLVDQVIFATGYQVDLARVPYLAGVLDRIEITNGFPMLDEAFGASLSDLYLPGLAATRDFGLFFGFVKGSPAAATLIVRDLLARP
jgi:FAD-dependent urate hydroxylase